MNHITTDYTGIPVLIYQTGYTIPTIVKSLEKFAKKKERYDKKILGAIGKKESENDVVRITLQSHQFKLNNVIIPKVKGDGTYLMSISYANPNHREKVIKLYTVQDEGKTTKYVPIVVMMPSILDPIFCNEEKCHGSCTKL